MNTYTDVQSDTVNEVKLLVREDDPLLELRKSILERGKSLEAGETPAELQESQLGEYAKATMPNPPYD